MRCICGHAEKEHVPGGRCRVPDCPCELFQPGFVSSTLGWAPPASRLGWGVLAPTGEARPPRGTAGFG